jgi:hypothetical protein
MCVPRVIVEKTAEKCFWRKRKQKAWVFFELLEETTTSDEQKCLNHSKLSYTNTKLCTEVKKGCLRKTKNGKRGKTKNGKKKNGKLP